MPQLKQVFLLHYYCSIFAFLDDVKSTTDGREFELSYLNIYTEQ